MIKKVELHSKYSAYVETGCQWLGKVPAHWGIKKFKHIGRALKGKLPKNIVSEHHANAPVYLTMDYLRGGPANGWVLDTDPLVVGDDEILLLWDGSNSGEFIKSRAGVVSSTVAKIDVFGVNKTFAWYLGNTLERRLRVSTVGMGIPHVDGEELSGSYSAIPPEEEQKAVVFFLDNKSTRIDRAIEVKRQQIKLLKERKQILIQNAVTRGLNPDAPMRDSDVEWLGGVPAHWKELRFKNLFSQSRLPVRTNDGVVTSYRDGQVTLRSNRRLEGYTEAVLEQGYQGIRKGQLVLNSMDAFEGAIGVSDSDGKCTPEYVVCDPVSDEFLPEYFAFLLREMALAKYIQVICNAVRQRAVRIRYNNLASRFLVVPPKSEQISIVEHVESESERIGAGIAMLHQQIEKLKEYKATLINSAVTGKIKVPQLAGREVAA